MINKLYISHKNFDWNNFHNIENLKFVNDKNYKKYIDTNEIYDAYTTPEDINLRLEEVFLFLRQPRQIIFTGINLDFFLNPANSESSTSWRYLIKSACNLDNVEGLEFLNSYTKENYKSSHTKRSTQATIFVAGCSISHGVGIADHERYGEIVANRLHMPCIHLTRSGSSLQWSTDRILQADICAGDIVLWGITSITRATITEKNKFDWDGYSINGYVNLPKQKQFFSLDYFNSETLITQSVKQILQVENFCKKIGAHLYLINLLDCEIIPLLYRGQANLIDCTNDWGKTRHMFGWADMASDNCHPGPMQHKQYAERILQTIQSDDKLRFNNAKLANQDQS